MFKKKSLFKFLKKSWPCLVLVFLLIVHLFFRFYQMEIRNPYGWDQVDNAWAAKNMIVDHQRPLLGMQAKLNAGFFIGPIYYYLVALVYYLTNLDPIASSLMAGLTSLFTFAVIYFLTKKLFSEKVALVAVFLHTFSTFVISQDRFQWPVNLIAPVSLIIFYSLYQVLQGKLNYLFLLAATIGFSFHLNFTSIFFPLIVLGALPFFPWSKKFLIHALVALPVFLVWLVPNFLAEFNQGGQTSHHLSLYLQAYYHGFHLRRVFQLTKDAFIEFEGILLSPFSWLKNLKPLLILLLPGFLFSYLWPKATKAKLFLGYLVVLWFLVPWLVFSLYSGEISNYYFSLTRPIALFILGYLLVRLYQLKNPLAKILVIVFFFAYAWVNTRAFLETKNYGETYQRQIILKTIKEGHQIRFTPGDWRSYLFYYYTRKCAEKPCF